MSEAVSTVAARHKAIQAEKERKIKQEEQRAKRIAAAQAVAEAARQQARCSRKVTMKNLYKL